MAGGKGQRLNRNAFAVLLKLQLLCKAGGIGRAHAQVHGIELLDHRAQAGSGLRIAADPGMQTDLHRETLQRGHVFVNPLLRQTLFAQLAQPSGQLSASLKQHHLVSLGDQVIGCGQPAQSAADHGNPRALLRREGGARRFLC